MFETAVERNRLREQQRTYTELRRELDFLENINRALV